jgi:hypothetical protein
MEFWRQAAWAAAAAPDPALPPKKIFSPCFDLPDVNDYKSNPGPTFWGKFPHNFATCGKSWVNPDKLAALAAATQFPDTATLKKVCDDLRYGADIGCTGECRRLTVSKNAPSAFEFPAQITDAVAGWLKKGIAAGPFSPASRPANVKVNGIMCRAKPNGSARIILNMSSPKGDSVNDGIDIEQFPATMSSTAKWLAVLSKAGRHCNIMKVDWSDAYKHVHVRPADLPLQWFSWLGMDFFELGLIFGTSSSVGIFDRLAKVVLHIVLR